MRPRHGDYTALARDFARHRPGYAPEVARRLLDAVARADGAPLALADVGAGTGIWTRQLAAAGGAVVAVEPNDAMRAEGVAACGGLPIEWRAGSAEASGLEAGAYDLVTVASALHWTDLERATAELARALRPGGLLAALWNTRALEESPLAAELEAELARRTGPIERVSSGRSRFCATLSERLAASGRFAAVERFEARHVERMTPERAIGVWRSANDVRAQADERAFEGFLRWLAQRLAGLASFEVVYRTLVWTARTPGGAR